MIRVDYIREGYSNLGWIALNRGSLALLPERDRAMLVGTCGGLDTPYCWVPSYLTLAETAREIARVRP